MEFIHTGILSASEEVLLDISYEKKLCFSSDSLVILNQDDTLHSKIRMGKDKDGYIAVADDEDEFLDIINAIIYCINNKITVWTIIDKPKF